MWCPLEMSARGAWLTVSVGTPPQIRVLFPYPSDCLEAGLIYVFRSVLFVFLFVLFGESGEDKMGTAAYMALIQQNSTLSP